MTAGLLLAAGESSRMGRLKALLPWRGRTLLEAQIETLLAAGVAPLIVVLGHRASELRPLIPVADQVRVALNPRYLEGRTTSVAAGVRELPATADSVIIASVDQPLDVEVLRAMIEAHDRTGAAIVIPSIDKRRGHPGLFDARLVSELLTVTEEQAGLREVVDRHAEEIEYVTVSNPIVCVNLNTPEEYAAAYERFGKAE